MQDSTAITTTENSEKINTEKSETTESDKKDNISDTMVTTEEISTVDDNSAKSSTNLESGGEKSQISEREWKDAYIEKIQQRMIRIPHFPVQNLISTKISNVR